MSNETVEVLMRMPKIDGYSYTGELRRVNTEEYHEEGGKVSRWIASIGSINSYPVLKKDRWRATYGNKYYCIKDWRVIDYRDGGEPFDNKNWEIGNYFPAHQIASEKLTKITAMLLGEE